jgi:hypothetical protein
MAFIRCPAEKCNNRIPCQDQYDGTIQCDNCAAVVRVSVRDGAVVDAKLRKLDFEIPLGISDDLRYLLSQAVACYEAGSPAATVVLAGLFIEGLLATKGLKGDRLVEMIEVAHKAGMISTLGYHVATASRLIRNLGAHYSNELVQLTDSDARLVLEMTRKLASDIVNG